MTCRRGLCRAGPRDWLYSAAVVLYASLALCALVITVIVYRYDLYEHEPWWMLLLAIGLGAAAMHASGLIQVFLYTRLGPASTSNPLTVSLMAGTNEELAKFLVVLAIAVFLPRQFNDPLDGIIYGAMVGLGAAIEESTVFLRREGPATLPPAEIVRLCGHLIMGGIGAAGLGLVVVSGASGRHDRSGSPPSPASHPPRWSLVPITLAAAMVLHIAWDLIAVPANDSGRMTTVRTLMSIALMLGGLGAFAGLTMAAQRRSRTLFAPGDPLSPSRRMRAGKAA